MTTSDVSTLSDKWVMPTYRRQPVTFVRGQGMYLFDDEGNSYLDFVAGIAVTALGHSHPAFVSAIADQSARLVHTSNLYYTEPMAHLAEKLCSLLGWDDGRVFFANSGAEANECAIKLVRRHSKHSYGEGRDVIVAAKGSFHGRTLETLAATGQPAKWEPFLPLHEGFRHVPYDDAEALDDALTPDVAAVMLEPVQGEGGIVVPSPRFLESVGKTCDKKNVAFIADEVQTGLGRTGRWFGFQHADCQPSVITLAKALGNGLPIGACIARGELATAFERGDHATTVGGGPVVCAASLAVLETIEKEGLVENASSMGEHLQSELRRLASSQPLIKQVRGMGLLLAVELHQGVAGRIVDLCRGSGLLINEVLPETLRLAPPLVVGRKECDDAVTILAEALSAIGKGERT